MNIYFLVEGSSTEKRFYPKFIDAFFDGKLKQVKEFYQVRHNDYFLLSANGYPGIFGEILENTILDINSSGNYDYLIICLDADENSIEERKLELEDHLNSFKVNGIALNNDCKLELIVQNRCIETWFLGNKRVYKRNPDNMTLRQFQRFYNVHENDPELMPVYNGFNTHAQFHFAYLREMLLEKNIRYTKKFPRDVAEKHYIDQLILRAEEDQHIQSFSYFIKLCEKIKREL